MRLRATLFLLFSLRLVSAEEVRLEDDGAFGHAQFVQWNGECGFLTPAHVFDALHQPFRIRGKSCRILSVRRFAERDLLFFVADVTGESPMKLNMRLAQRGNTEFRLPGPEKIDPEAWRGRSGMLEHDPEGRPGLFVGLDRRTRERICVRIDDLPGEEP